MRIKQFLVIATILSLPFTVFGQPTNLMRGQTNQGIFYGGLGVPVLDAET
jgi:hypothetical protein